MRIGTGKIIKNIEIFKIVTKFLNQIMRELIKISLEMSLRWGLENEIELLDGIHE